MRTIRRGIAALVIAAGAIALPAAPALAAGDDCYIDTLYIDGDLRSWVSFCSYGERFTAWDRAKDNMSAAINWKVEGRTGSYTLWATGKGNSEGFNADYREGAIVKFRACVGHANQSGFTDCGNWNTASA